MADLTKSARAAQLLAIEQTFAETGKLPPKDHPLAPSFSAHFQSWDARLVENLVLQSEVHPLEELRSNILRGRISDAARLVESAKDLNSREASEFLVEGARVEVANGNWSRVLELTQNALRSDPLPLSRLAILQIEALALFEMGYFVEAKTNLEKVDSMARVLPNCSANTYAKVLKIRLLARMQTTSVARRELAKLWASTQLNQNFIQTYLRTEIDILRLERRPHFAEAFGSWLIAEAMGEKLYASLAVVDCVYSENSSARDFFGAQLQADAKEFARVNRLLEEIHSNGIRSTSAQTLNESRPAAMMNTDVNDAAEAIVILGAGVLLDLKSGRVLDLKQHPQFSMALTALHQGSRGKADFFKAVWGNQKYAANLHDGLIYAILHRMKKKIGITGTIIEGHVVLSKVHFINGEFK